MAFFQPTRTSPKAPTKTLATNSADDMLSALDCTISSTTSNAVAALSGLSPHVVRIIDEIIRRVPKATTFPAMFKAYNTVLQEHNLDAANDVVYFKILLKVGVVKGQDWGSRWEAVKDQLGYDTLDDQTESEAEVVDTSVAVKVPRETTYAARLPPLDSYMDRSSDHRRHDEDMYIDPGADSASELGTFTLHSHREDGTATEDEDEDEDEGALASLASQDTPTTLVQPVPTRISGRNALHLQSIRPPLPSITEFLPVQAKRLQNDRLNTYDMTNAIASSSRSAETVTSTTPKKARDHTIRNDRVRLTRPLTSLKPSPSPVKDVEDTWKRIEMERHEKDADHFRDAILCDRYFHLWLNGLRWIIDMHTKVSVRRDIYIRSNAMDRWIDRLEERRQQYQYAIQRSEQSEICLLREILGQWKRRTRSRRMVKWREDMRARMVHVREMVHKNNMSRCWLEWRRVYQMRLSYSWYEQLLQKRFLSQWKMKHTLIRNRELEALQFKQVVHQKRIPELWNIWKIKATLLQNELRFSNEVATRILIKAMLKWRACLKALDDSENYHDQHLLKVFFAMWKKRLKKNEAMQRKADGYKTRQDTILVYAIMRIWIAKERGLLLERTVNVRRAQKSWSIWSARLQNMRLLENKAGHFARQNSATVLRTTMDRWNETLLKHRNLSWEAQKNYETYLQARLLRGWRLQLRENIRLAEKAKLARKYLILKKPFIKWLEATRTIAVEKKKMQKYFDIWRRAAARSQFLRFKEKKMEAEIIMRRGLVALITWRERMLFVKDREYRTGAKHDQVVLRNCLEKWKTSQKRCLDMNRLMQSCIDVKNEELLRRAFHSWMVFTKTTRERRVDLAEREEEARLIHLATAWDTWRERLQALRLAPREKVFHLQQNNNILFRTFMIWSQKTMIIPAIRFRNDHVKDKYWLLWRHAMPMALMAKKARDFDKRKLSTRILDKWVQAYRTKIALKAVARARYLRLPSGAPRKSMHYSSVLSGALQSSRTAPSTTSRKSTRAATVTDDGDDEIELDVRSESHVDGARFGRSPRLLPLARRPARSQAGSDDGKVDVWLALRRRGGQIAGPPSTRSEIVEDGD